MQKNKKQKPNKKPKHLKRCFFIRKEIAMRIRQQLVSDSLARQVSFGKGNPKKYITVHQTGNTSKGANAQAHANLQSRGWGASWHWQVDDKEAIQSFSHDWRLWHAGDNRGPGNMESIGIESCINADGNYVQAVKNTAKLVAKIMKDENIPIENVKQHYNWSGKDCPQQIRAGQAGITWAKFIDLVKAEVAPNSTSKPKKISAYYKIDTDKINIHEKAWSDSKIIASAKQNEVIFVSEEWGNWVYSPLARGWFYKLSATKLK